MRILVINSGSSSLKFSVFDGAPGNAADPHPILEGEVSGIGTSRASLRLKGAGQANDTTGRPAPEGRTPADASSLVLDLLTHPGMPQFDAIGYRVVHPGPHLAGSQRITPSVMEALEHAVSFAPLHDPAALEVIRTMMDRFPQVSHVACFDTEFHRTMPEEASIYPIPSAIRDTGVHRYGFHGLSCESVVHQLRVTGADLPVRMVIAHLGSGCSVTAVRNGESVDTTMGLTPDGGVVMGTRGGDFDPGLVLYLLRQDSASRDEALSAVEAMLNRNAGLVALSGLENNMEVLRAAAAAGNPAARLAACVFTRSLRKAIGGFAWLLGGLDAIVFTGGIGEHDAATRSEVLAGLEGAGIALDPNLNAATGDTLRDIGAPGAPTRILVVPAQEDLMIALHVHRVVQAPDPGPQTASSEASAREAKPSLPQPSDNR